MALDRGDGVCKHYLKSTYQCSIYSNRPDVCRIEQGHALFFTSMNFDEYLALNAQACNALQAQQGWNEIYRIVL